jgi:hypothetical protein
MSQVQAVRSPVQRVQTVPTFVLQLEAVSPPVQQVQAVRPPVQRVQAVRTFVQQLQAVRRPPSGPEGTSCPKLQTALSPVLIDTRYPTSSPMLFFAF